MCQKHRWHAEECGDNQENHAEECDDNTQVACGGVRRQPRGCDDNPQEECNEEFVSVYPVTAPLDPSKTEECDEYLPKVYRYQVSIDFRIWIIDSG